MTLDLHQIAAFIDANPHGFPNLIDLPYRLASWSLENPENLRVWEADGQIQAVGMVQLPWLALDYAYSPAAEVLVPEIFAWFAERCSAIAKERGEEESFAIYLSPERADHIPLAEAAGFTLDDDWTIIHLERELESPLPAVDLPEGFAFRLMGGRVEAYVDLHQAAFGSKNMRVSWRARTLTLPQYRPKLDLFIVDQMDRPAALSVGWISGTVGQIEPLGVHPDYQRLGLGRAALLEGLRRLQRHGARTAYIHVYKHNDPALALYQLANNGSFRPKYELSAYVRSFT
jgi:mycothiol synthase